jgi:PAS domain S-box-containing protein
VLILILPSGPLSMPDEFELASPVRGLPPLVDAVVLCAGADFGAWATAFLCAQAGAEVLALEDAPPLPPELAFVERVAEPTSAAAGPALTAALELARARRTSAVASFVQTADAEGDALRQALERSDSLKANLEAEQQRRREAEERINLLGLALDDIAEAVCVTSPQGRLLSVNQAFLAPTGLDDGALLIGRALDEFFEPDEVGGERVEPLLFRLRSASPQSGTFRRRDAQGEVKRHVGTFSRFVYGGGQIERVVAVFRDITDQARFVARVVQSERLTALGQLAAGVAHEINNPLSSVLNMLELLRPHVRAPGGFGAARDPAQLLAAALEGCQRIKTVVGDLKQLTRADAERLEVVDLTRVVEFALRVGANDLRHRARVELENDGAPAVLGNEARLGQVFINLLYNAMQAMPTGNVEAMRITVRLAETLDGEALIEVEDTGAGMLPEAIERVFDPGLGLSICRDVVEAHGGSISLESQLGRGTRVRIRLPAAPSAEAPAPIKPRERRPCEDGPVLLVDDEDDLRESLSWLLEPTPTASARSIGEARARILQGGVSAVLCDLQMPTGLGTDLLDWLREADPRLATRFAFMTGGALTPSARAALEGSGVPILEKPFGRDAVVALLDSLAPTC